MSKKMKEVLRNKYAVIYEDNNDGIATTETQYFYTRNDAQAYYNKLLEEGTEQVSLCEILKTNQVN